MATVTTGIAQTLLEQDTEPLRFERFCKDLVSKIEGDVQLVTTSFNYDRSRDALSVGPGPSVVVLCSLADNVDTKALRDVKNLVKGVAARKKLPAAIYFCSSQPLTEKKSDELEQLLRKELTLPADYEHLTVLSGRKLAQLGSKQAGLFEKHYPGELHDIRKMLADAPDAAQAEHALRLALSTSGADEAADIRDDVWKVLIRLQLSQGTGTPGALAKSVSDYLRLSSTLSTSVLLPHLESLAKSGEVEVDEGTYSLSEKGREAFENDEARVARGVFQGKEALTGALKAQLKTEITPQQAERMWQGIQDQLATLFHERGQEVLSQVATIIGRSHGSSDNDDDEHDFDLVASLATAAANAFPHPQQNLEVETAVRDIILEGDSDAVKWLTRTAYAFVCACAMGLEARTRSALEDVVSGTNLIFDTDVVLSLLSPDEPEHEAVKAIRDRWKNLGGKVLLADEVAAEVAYHAWIAQTDSEHTGSHFLGSRVDRHLLSKNAFVRGFWHLVAKGKARQHQWSNWLAQFRGRERGDTAVTRRTLMQEYGFRVLPPPSGTFRKLAEKARLYLVEQADQSKDEAYDEHGEFIRRDKAKRDAHLFAATLQIREKGDEAGLESTFLLTSSRRFGRLQRKFRPKEESFVLTIPTVLYLLSMAPDRGLGLTALRAFLFDERWKERLSDFELMALRVVKRSHEFDMPWAKRSMLLRYLQARVRRVAIDRSKAQSGAKVTDAEVEKEWTSSEGRDQMLRELAGALDDVAADRRAEVELAKAQAEIADLKRQLAERDRPGRNPKDKKTD